MIINIDSSIDLSGFYVIYNTTIKNEKKGIRGISHFIEHLMCKKFEDQLNDYEENGISWNAYTSDNKIVFYITGLDNYLKDFKKIFVDKLIEFDVSDKDVELEKKIIIEEYTDTFNKQSSSHFLNLYRKLFNNYNPIGDINDIKNIDKYKIINHKNEFYSKPSKIINISKNYPFEYDYDFNELKNDYEINYIKNNDYTYQKSNIFKSKISLIYLSKIINDDYPYVNFITSLIGNGLKSPLYQETREKNGLVYYINCHLDHLTDKSSVINISSQTNDEKVDYLNDKINYIFNNKEKFITKKRFETIKKSFKIHYKKSEIFRYKNITKYLSPNHWLIEPILDDITIDKIYEVFDKYFIFEDFYISYDKTEFLEKM